MSRRDRIDERYRENLALLPDYREYIFSQWSPAVKGLRFGEHGHVGREGCGAVAVHNVMKFIGREQNFCDVLHDFEELRMPWLGARFGTKPHSLGRYFRRHKIPYWKYSSPNDFKAALLTHRIGIVCTWNKKFKGMHVYCVRYSPEDGAYYTANLGGGSDFKEIAPGEISNLRFITGYVIE